jgi:hypothetical protein
LLLGQRRVDVQFEVVTVLDAQVDFVLRAVESAERPRPIPAKRAKRKKK